jgi:3-oxoadipate enol-lactonase
MGFSFLSFAILNTREETTMPRIQVNDVELYYEVNGAGPALLLLHGLGSSTRDWEAQVPEFCKKYKVVTFDLRGHGRSDKPSGPYSPGLFAADTAGLLTALGIESAHVVGESLGGAVAFQLAISFPARVRTLVIVNSAPMMADKQTAEQRVAVVRQHGVRAMGELLGKGLFPKPEQASLRATFTERWAENDPQAYIEATLSLVGWDVTDRLGSIRCPTLVISADQDYWPLAAKEAYTKLIPGARLVVIPDSHHALPIEKPQEFNTVLWQFMKAQG